MKKSFYKSSLYFLSTFLIFTAEAKAKEVGQYPNVSGTVLFELKPDRVTSTNKQGVSPNNILVNIEPDLSLNVNKNWSVKTGLRIYPIVSNNSANPERSRTILGENRGVNFDDEGIIIEELKAQFENEDMKFSAGKYDATFATMYRKSKRIGVFNTDFTEDYELRERIGANITALLEDSEITVNGFFNDTTGLSESAINDRGRAKRSDGLAGNTNTLSSYSVTMEGQRLFNVENLFYNIGYRSLGVDGGVGRARETGQTVSVEYLMKVGNHTSLTPLIELVRLNNFTGERGRDTTYSNMALIGKYSSWTASVSSVVRNNKHSQLVRNGTDHQIQVTAGYKFANNVSLDVSRASIKEDGSRGALIGAMLSYLYKF